MTERVLEPWRNGLKASRTRLFLHFCPIFVIFDDFLKWIAPKVHCGNLKNHQKWQQFGKKWRKTLSLQALPPREYIIYCTIFPFLTHCASYFVYIFSCLFTISFFFFTKFKKIYYFLENEKTASEAVWPKPFSKPWSWPGSKPICMW